MLNSGMSYPEGVFSHIPTKQLAFPSVVSSNKTAQSLALLERTRRHIHEDVDLRQRLITTTTSNHYLHAVLDTRIVDSTVIFDYAYIPQFQKLDDYLLAKNVTTATFLDLIDAVFAGPFALHLAGIIHRDLKASNYILTPEGLQLTDMEMVDLADKVPAVAAIGTLDFAAPEAWEPGTILTIQSDIFSLGMTVMNILAIVWANLLTVEATLADAGNILGELGGNETAALGIMELELNGFHNTARALLKALYFSNQRRYDSVLSFRNFFVPAYISDLNALSLYEA